MKLSHIQIYYDYFSSVRIDELFVVNDITEFG